MLCVKCLVLLTALELAFDSRRDLWQAAGEEDHHPQGRLRDNPAGRNRRIPGHPRASTVINPLPLAAHEPVATQFCHCLGFPIVTASSFVCLTYISVNFS